jgi:hypothetical protein
VPEQLPSRDDAVLALDELVERRGLSTGPYDR